MYEAAANGMGVAIAVPAVSESYLNSGRLRSCFGGTSDLRMHYSLVFATDAIRRRPDVRALTNWMTSEIDQSAMRYEAAIGNA
jgi:DNA-binding transcriptional LysR family regulator